jgi:hypothetical protein
VNLKNGIFTLTQKYVTLIMRYVYLFKNEKLHGSGTKPLHTHIYMSLGEEHSHWRRGLQPHTFCQYITTPGIICSLVGMSVVPSSTLFKFHKATVNINIFGTRTCIRLHLSEVCHIFYELYRLGLTLNGIQKRQLSRATFSLLKRQKNDIYFKEVMTIYSYTIW